MKIEVFAICYNEEALLPYFLRHYSAFCQKITVFDNFSTDRSNEICLANKITEVIPYNTGDQIRDDIYLQIKNNCWKGSKADWVIICDIDELVYHPFIHTVLSSTEATAIAPPLFNMFASEFPTTPLQIWDEVMTGVPGGAKLNLFRPYQVKEINYDPGCHVCFPEGNIILDKNSEIKTLHMKNLSEKYVIERTLLSHSRLSELNKQMGWGIHYNYSIDEMKRQFREGLSNSVNIIG